jgi:hypothetical protein
MKVGWIVVVCIGLFEASDLRSGCVQGGSSQALSEPAMSDTARTLHELEARDQRNVEDVVSWGGRILVFTDPPSLLDVKDCITAPLDLPEGLKFLFPAEHDHLPIALFNSPDGGLQVLGWTGEHWTDRGLPGTSYDPETSAPVLAADSQKIVVLAFPLLLRFENGAWTTIAVTRIGHERDGIFFPAPKHAVIDGRLLYLGCDDGEWGGDLVALNIDTGEMLEVMNGMEGEEETPVRCIRVDRHGILWCVRGLAHMGGRRGFLYRRTEQCWTLIASSQSDGYEEDDKVGGDWNLPGTSFDAVGFDASDAVYLLTQQLGLVRQDAGKGWTRLTPDWLRGIYVDGLLIQGRTAVIGVADSGILLIDLDDRSCRRVATSR